MSYEKTNWQNGDTITAEKLNNLEEGVKSGNNYMIINFSYDETKEPNILYSDKTMKEILEASLIDKKFLYCNLDPFVSNGNAIAISLANIHLEIEIEDNDLTSIKNFIEDVSINEEIPDTVIKYGLESPSRYEGIKFCLYGSLSPIFFPVIGEPEVGDIYYDLTQSLEIISESGGSTIN